VIDGKSPREVLQAMGIGPDIEVAGRPDTFIDFIHRATAEADIYFLANRNDRAENAAVTFRQTGRQPELWNPLDGSQRDLPRFTVEAGRTTVPLEFEPHGSMFIVFRKPLSESSGKPNFAALAPVREVQGPWTVRFDKEWFYPTAGLTGPEAQGVMVFQTLQDWSQRPEPAVKYFSGTATYQADFPYDQDEAGNRRHWLDLGRVNVSAAVRLNGVDLGVVWCPPWRVDVGRALRKGANKLEIEVVNQWPNRMIGDGNLPEVQRKTKSNITRYYRKPPEGDHALTPSGLQGPVTLLRQVAD
jgi:hypothetical protein